MCKVSIENVESIRPYVDFSIEEFAAVGDMASAWSYYSLEEAQELLEGIDEAYLILEDIELSL